jgi:hypothetical protein
MTRHLVPALLSSIFLVLALPVSVARAQEAPWTTQLKPQVNPELTNLPDNTWKLMKPQGDAFNHPKTEVGLVYDEGIGGVIYFGGCCNGYCNNVWVYHVGTNTWKEVMPWIKGKEEDTGKPIGQCGYYAVYNNDLGLYFKHRACSSTSTTAAPSSLACGSANSSDAGSAMMSAFSLLFIAGGETGGGESTERN